MVVTDSETKGTFLGEVKPMAGRWQWPLKDMKTGDWFIVSHVNRSTDDVRNYVSVRAAQLNRSFNVMANDPENVGYTRVTAVPYGMARELRRPVMEYGAARQKILEWFGVWLDHFNLGQLEAEPTIKCQALFIDEEAPERLVFHMDTMTIGLECNAEREELAFHRLPTGWTLKVWERLYDDWSAQTDADSLEERLRARLKVRIENEHQNLPRLKKAELKRIEGLEEHQKRALLDAELRIDDIME